MDKIKKIIKRMFLEELDIQHKLLNLILSAAFAGGIVSLVITIALEATFASVMTIMLLIVVVGLSLWIANGRNKPQVAAFLLVFVANMMLFPIMYFTSGGMLSGMPVWMVLGMIFSWLILKSPVCFIMYGLNALAVVGCIVLEMLYPDMVIPMERKAAYWDMVQSMLVVTCIFGIIFKYQAYVYEKQKQQILKASQVKSDFLANMSHEVRTPINAILGYNEMILKESRESQTAEYALNVQSAGMSLLAMLNSILEVTNGEKPEEVIQKEIKQNYSEIEFSEEENFEAPEVKILAVDDNAMNLDLLKGMLKRTKIQIDIGMNGKEAVDLVRKNTYHLIIIDHMMPVMDGVEALRIMRKEKLCDNTPILVLTANAVGNAKEKYLEEGFNDYLSKPVHSSQLFAMLKKYLPEELLKTEQERVQEIEQKGFLEGIDFLDTATGMEYCCNSEEFYKEMLSSYLSNSKYQEICKRYQEESWDKYRILVHALKSTSLSIGAVEVSNEAKKLEMAAKENRIEDIRTNHDRVMSIYQELLAKIEDALTEKVEVVEIPKQPQSLEKEHILVVDDDAMNLRIAEKILKSIYKVDCVTSGQEALEYLENNIPNLVLLDIHMPQMDGFAVLEQIRQREKLKSIPVVFLTADNDREVEIRGFREGALEFITKPFVADIMIQRIKRILELDRLQKNLQQEVARQTKTAEDRRIKIENLSLQIMLTLANTIDAKDKYTNGHSLRVAEYAREIAKRVGKSEHEQEDIYFAGLLHDIGKIGIPGKIISKTSGLTDEEYKLIKNHPQIGAGILESMTEIPGLAVGAHWHHELYDGTGYPDGLKEEEIPEIARIIGVADAYDAMASKRSYRDILPQEVVRAEIAKGRGTQFDPVFADIMLQMIDEDKDYQMKE
ncbi:MAG: response regulator [Lachnospiraceae bacterium]|nr:response regulator [Lachnospiraceae bacterium]